VVSGAGARTLCRSSTTGELDSTGQAGDITINTNQLTISGDGATIFSATQGSGQAGDISIQTRQLQVNNGAQIVATTLGDGLGGNIDVLALVYPVSRNFPH